MDLADTNSKGKFSISVSFASASIGLGTSGPDFLVNFIHFAIGDS